MTTALTALTTLIGINQDGERETHLSPEAASQKEKEINEFLNNVKYLIAEREKIMVAKRIIAAQKMRMHDGKGWGRAPFGYTFNHIFRRYEVDEAYAWVIPVIDQMFLEEKLGMTAIANRLNDLTNGEIKNSGMLLLFEDYC